MSELLDEQGLDHLQGKFGVAADLRTYPSADNGPLSYNEIARRLGLSAPTVRRAEETGLQKLRDLLEREGTAAVLRELLR